MPNELQGYIAIKYKINRKNKVYAQVVLYDFEGDARGVWPHWSSPQDLIDISKHYIRIPDHYVDEPISRFRTRKLRQ